MEKLNELIEVLYPQYGAPGSRDVDITARRKEIDEAAAAIAEAFRSLEQRAEAAEAKLAELEKQEAYGYVHNVVNPPGSGVAASIFKEESRHYGRPVFTRPAPAINLAEMVPVPPEFLSAEQNSQGMFELSEDCMTRLAIALSQQAKGLVIKPGYALVPVEPSWEMISAAIKSHEGDAFLPVSLYKSMLAAAPEVE